MLFHCGIAETREGSGVPCYVAGFKDNEGGM